MPPEIDIRDIRKEIFPVQQPLSFDLIKAVVNSENPLAALKEITSPLPEQFQYAVQEIDPKIMGGCVDDRRRVASGFRVAVASNNTIQIPDFNLQLEFKGVNRDELSLRKRISSRPLPGGAAGVDQMVLYAALTSGALQNQRIWTDDHDPNTFASEILHYIHPVAEKVRSGYNIPVHIDNHHGEMPVTGVEGKIITDNIQELVEEGGGCGAAGSFFETTDYLLRLDGNNELADQFAERIGADRREDGIITVNTDIKKATARQLVLSAMQKSSSRLDIYVGAHKAPGIVFSTGGKSVNRAVLQKKDPELILFRSDLYDRNSISPMSVMAGRVSENFRIDVDPFRLGVALNLATYAILKQQSVPRYIVK